MLDLYKLEVQSKQNFQMQQIIQNNVTKQQAILEQQLREQFNNGMMLLQQSADIFNSLHKAQQLQQQYHQLKLNHLIVSLIIMVKQFLVSDINIPF